MSLSEPALFFSAMKNSLMGPTLDSDEVNGCNAILEVFANTPSSWCAYALATAWHETAHSMRPCVEANWLSRAVAERYFFRMYDIGGQRPAKARELGNVYPGDGVKYCGRGYAQVTGRTNYEKAAKLTGADLINHPEFMTMPHIAALVMRDGMERGSFTGVSLTSVFGQLPGNYATFKRARRIINGQDRADDIAEYAVKFQHGLNVSGWKQA